MIYEEDCDPCLLVQPPSHNVINQLFIVLFKVTISSIAGAAFSKISASLYC